jgi:hypothetical protein
VARRAVFTLAAVAATACGLLAPPGGYAAGEEATPAATEAGTTDATTAPDVVVLPDGNVVPASAGTITLAAGERDPTSPADNPAWSGDLWSGILDANGHVATWRVGKSAPVVGPFDTSAVLSGKWFTLSFGLGIGGGRGTALSSIDWAPGPTGDWRVAGVGMPAGLDELARAFFGAHVLTVGGVRYEPNDGGTTTIFTDEVHVADVDVAKGELGAFAPAGVSLVDERARAGLLVVGGHAYVVGGRSPGGVTASVELAKVDATTGAVQAFSAQPALKHGGQEHKVAEVALAGGGGFVFAAGGRNAANAPVDVVLSAKIQADGTLVEWKTLTALPKPLFDLALVVHKDVLYAMGGQTAAGRSASVYSARVAADGTIAAWEEGANAPLPGKRSDITAVAY